MIETTIYFLKNIIKHEFPNLLFSHFLNTIKNFKTKNRENKIR